MPLLFKMQRTLVNFSLTLILRIFDTPKLLRNGKGYLISQIFEEREETRKIFTGFEHEKKHNLQVLQRNEMLS